VASKIAKGTIVDATIIGAPSSAKNKDGKRDPEMHQVTKGNQWYFGMKAHVGVDSKTKLLHTILASAANVADALALPHLLHGKETGVWGDQAYRGQKEAMHVPAPRAGLYQPAVSMGQSDRCTDQVHEPHQIARASEGRARVRRDEEYLRLPEDALSGRCQEPAPPGSHGGSR
jgi:hypothetical protein